MPTLLTDPYFQVPPLQIGCCLSQPALMSRRKLCGCRAGRWVAGYMGVELIIMAPTNSCWVHENILFYRQHCEQLVRLRYKAWPDFVRGQYQFLTLMVQCKGLNAVLQAKVRKISKDIFNKICILNIPKIYLHWIIHPSRIYSVDETWTITSCIMLDYSKDLLSQVLWIYLSDKIVDTFFRYISSL